MHWVRDEKPIEHHLSGWHDYAYHHHETGQKKMLGGVSFEGGGAAGGSKRNTVPQTGVQTAQPSFSDIQVLGLEIDKSGAGKLGNSLKGSDTKITGASGNRKDTLSIQGDYRNIEAKEKALQTETVTAMQAAETMAAAAAQSKITDADKITSVTENIPVKARNRFDFGHQKLFGKLQSGIRAFLKGMNQKAGKDNRQKPKKEEKSGTHAITKEEVYEIRTNTAYLLDSYNKHGERSTLGK